MGCLLWTLRSSPSTGRGFICICFRLGGSFNQADLKPWSIKSMPESKFHQTPHTHTPLSFFCIWRSKGLSFVLCALLLSFLFGAAHPAYADPIATALVLDHSGSMDSNDRNDIRIAAAGLFADLMENGADWGASIGFDDSSSVQVAMTRDTAALKSGIRESGGGGTNYRPALQHAYDELNGVPSVADNRKAAVLFSDGDPYDSYEDVLQVFAVKGWRIFPIGFGSANDSVMQHIAGTTGGTYYKVTTDNMQEVMITVISRIRGESPPDMDDEQIGQDEHVVRYYTLSANLVVDWIKFTAIWEYGSRIDFYVVSPTGQTFKDDFSSSNYGVYTVFSPPSGTWALHMVGEHAADGTIDVSYGTAVDLSDKGNIRVTCSQAGAECRLGSSGTWYATPRTFQNLNPGTHTVYARKSGYNTASKQVSLSGGELESVNFNLTRQTGSIHVTCAQTGAQCSLGSSGPWYATPYTFSNKPVGSYTVYCKKSAYHDASKSIYLSSGEQENVPFDLQPVGSISITSPAGDTLWERGAQQTISWDATEVDHVKIELFRGAYLASTLSSSVVAADGQFTYTVPADMATGDDYKVKLTSLENSAVYGWSAPFKIVITHLLIGAVTVEADGIWETGAGSDIWTAGGNVLLGGLLASNINITADKNSLIITGAGRLSIGPLAGGLVPETTLWDGQFEFNVAGAVLNLAESLFQSGFDALALAGFPINISSLEFKENTSGIPGIEFQGVLGLPDEWSAVNQSSQGAGFLDAQLDFGEQGRYLRIDPEGISFIGKLTLPDVRFGTWGLKDSLLEFAYHDPVLGDYFRAETTLFTPAAFDVEGVMAWKNGILDLIGVGVDFDDPGKIILYGPPPAAVPIIFFQSVYGELYALAPGPPPWGFRIGEMNEGLLDPGLELTVGPEYNGYYALKGALGMDINSAGSFWGAGELFVFNDDYRIARGDVYIAKDYGVYVGAEVGWTFDTLLVDGEMNVSGKMFNDIQNILRAEFSGRVWIDKPWPWGDSEASALVFLKIAAIDEDDLPDKYVVGRLTLGELEKSFMYDFVEDDLECPANMELIEEISLPILSSPALSGAHAQSADSSVLTPLIDSPGRYVFILRTALDTSGYELERPDGSRITPVSAGDHFYAESGKGAFYVIDIPQEDLGEWALLVTDQIYAAGPEAEIRRIKAAPQIDSATVTPLGTGRFRIAWNDLDPAEGLVTVLYSLNGKIATAVTIETFPASDTTNSVAWDTADVASGDYVILVMLEQAGQVPAVRRAEGRVPVINPDAPPAPTGFSATGEDGTLSVTWDQVPGAAGCAIEYRDVASLEPWPLSEATEAGATSLDIIDVKPGHTYQVRIRSFDQETRFSQWVEWVNVTIEAAPGSNAPPVMTFDLSSTARVGQAYTGTVLISDAEGDPVSLSLLSGPIGLTLTPDGQVAWTPTEDQIGWQSIEVQADDGHPDGVETRRFKILVLHQGAPADMDEAGPSLEVADLEIETWGDCFEYTFEASTLYGEALTFSVTGLPDGATLIDHGDGTATLRWCTSSADIGVHGPITITVSNGSAQTTRTFHITVKDLRAVITSPAGEAKVRSTIDISGTCWAADDFAGGLLEIMLEGGNWTLLTTIDTPVEDGTLYAGLDTTSYPDGAYIIRLRAMDWEGSYGEMSVRFEVDNTAPSLKRDLLISSPFHGLEVCLAGERIAAFGRADEDVDISAKRLVGYDGQDLCSWNVVASMNKSRGDHTSVVVDGRIYAIGGDPEENSVEVYDPAHPEFGWQLLPPMQHAGWAHTSVVVDGKIYAIIEGCAEVYDPAHLEAGWQAISSPNQNRYLHTSVVVDGRIYAIGGGGYPHSLSSVEVYDPAHPEFGWQLLPYMNQGRRQHTSVVVGGKIYAIGGFNYPDSLSSVEVYDPAHPETGWRLLPSMNNRRCVHTSVVVDGKIYAIGGESGGNSVEVYDPAHPEFGWQRLPSMNYHRSKSTSVVVDGKIYAISGFNGGSSVEVYDPAHPETGWQRLPYMNNLRYAHTSVVVDGKIYAIGGFNYLLDSLSSVEVYDAESLSSIEEGEGLIYGFFSAPDGSDEAYRLEIALSDETGNSTPWISSNYLTVGGIVPETIIRPSYNANVEPEDGMVTLTGMITDPAGVVEEVSWSKNSSDWHACSLDPDLWEGALYTCTVPVVGFQSNLQVKCSDIYGNEFGPIEVTFRHNSSLPVAEITAPAGTLWDTEVPIAVAGNVYNRPGQTDFSWTLEVAPGDGSAGGWETVVSGSTTEVREGTLFDWTFPDTPGIYTFKLTAANSYGSVETTRTVLFSGKTTPDWDGDGLSNAVEQGRCTDFDDADTDDDGIPDGLEDANHNGVLDTGETDPCNPDTDGDGIQDGTELGYTLDDIGSDTDTHLFQPDLDPATTTDPLDSDTDRDGLSDGAEDPNYNGRVDPGETDPRHPDDDDEALKVNLEPKAAVDAGAKWRMDGGAWLESGMTISGLSSGEYTVTFAAVDKWIPPGMRVISISGGETTGMTVVYKQQTGRIPDTGQTGSYTGTAGEDSDYLINPPSYTKLDGEGNEFLYEATEWAMVRDNVTGLIWEVKTNDGSVHDRDNVYTWQNAQDVFIAALNSDSFGGYTNWRVPTIKELDSITDLGRGNPAIVRDYFPNTVSSNYWSSTTDASNASTAWTMDFYYGSGYSYAIHKYYTFNVRAVRGGQTGSFDPLVINGDDTVTDTMTGLMWQQATDGAMNWEAAISHCEALPLAGYTDWRLPNRKELRSIVDCSFYLPAIDIDYFPDTVSSFYWSSTTWANDTSQPWDLYFDYGRDSTYYNKSYSYYMRAVRGGQNRLLGHLVILSPVQGSRWDVGSSVPITWDTEEINGNVKITLSRHGGKADTFETIIESTENDGFYKWPTISGPVSCNCVLKIEPLDDPSKGTTQSLFTIASTVLPTTVISGTPDNPTNQTGATLTVGDESIISYKYRLDEDDYGEQTLVTNPIVLADLIDGSHTIYVLGRDAAGDWQSEPTTVTWIVDTLAPTITGLSTDTTPTQEKTWTWDAGETGTFRYAIDQNETWTPTGDFGDAKTASKGGVDGNWYLHVQAKDTAGNESGVTTVSVILDNTAPTATISGAPESTTNQTGATLTIGGEGVTHHKYKLDEGGYGSETPIETPISLSSLGHGSHTVSVLGCDLAGNWQEAPTTASWTVLTSLTITATAGPGGTISPSGSVTVLYSADQVFTIAPEMGYQVSDVQVDSASVRAVTTYTFTNVTTNHTIAASFTAFFADVIYVAVEGNCAGKSPCHASIQAAIDAAGDGAIINIAAGTYDEEIILDAPKALIIQGGWDASFTSQSSYTTLNGLIIRQGKIITSHLVLTAH